MSAPVVPGRPVAIGSAGGVGFLSGFIAALLVIGVAVAAVQLAPWAVAALVSMGG